MKDYLKIIGLIILDQVTKLAIRSNLEVGQGFDLIPGICSITYVENFGAAWNSFSGQNLVLIGVPIIVIAIAIYLLAKYKDKRHCTFKYALILFIAGGLGNQIDRILMGRVTDMIDFHFWPVFNVADICVVIGAILLGVYVLFFEKEK